MATVRRQWLVAHGVDPRRAWPALRPGDERCHRLVVTLQERLDAAVGTVAHPAFHAESTRFIAQCIAITHALYAATDTNLPGLHASLPGRC